MCALVVARIDRAEESRAEGGEKMPFAEALKTS